MLGIRTQGRRMVGADETTELWRPPLEIDPFLMSTNFRLEELWKDNVDADFQDLEKSEDSQSGLPRVLLRYEDGYQYQVSGSSAIFQNGHRHFLKYYFPSF